MIGISAAQETTKLPILYCWYRLLAFLKIAIINVALPYCLIVLTLFYNYPSKPFFLLVKFALCIIVFFSLVFKLKLNPVYLFIRKPEIVVLHINIQLYVSWNFPSKTFYMQNSQNLPKKIDFLNRNYYCMQGHHIFCSTT